ncbi:MAG: acylneuraminate cytidylyltransferase family protein [Myxococcota bacterium]
MPRRILAIIPARSGSKGLRHKNIRKIAGKRLLVRAIELAIDSQAPRETWRIAVTTDSPYYARIARQAGAEVVNRPKTLATDRSRLIDAVLHALASLSIAQAPYDAVLLLSATTPLTRPRHVRAALARFERAQGASVCSVRLDPYADSWRFHLVNQRLDRHPRNQRVGRRQLSTPRYVLNGAIYISTPAWLKRYRQFVRPGLTRPLIMTPNESLDIENIDDFKIAEFILLQRRKHVNRSSK